MGAVVRHQLILVDFSSSFHLHTHDVAPSLYHLHLSIINLELARFILTSCILRRVSYL
ncbi:hypothetical protein B0F90DRAFT_1772265 [Multifurca ochricompacta]|uniref:Uncharacterized protein n=1 Tax=Multifurca ochricompacta TaxID=376703 RepID=A0AAD4QI72_9AGAM|nr:hypothetical protein B0F90DRAFT_1772265 [Multifurca ochricompacta]